LHDGAVIIQNDLIEAAKCTLPINKEDFAELEFGTRHLAGLTISHETDAMVIIVSEERGLISVALNGKLITDMTENRLKNILEEGFTYGESIKQSS